VVWIFFTSEPAEGSVIARHILFCPVRISGKTLFRLGEQHMHYEITYLACKAGDAYILRGGAPTT
jgi:hypothetical protein